MKKYINLDGIIIFIGGFIFLNSWSQSSILNFIIFFLAVLFYVWFSQKEYSMEDKLNLKKFYYYKQIILFILIGIIIGSTLGADIYSKSKDSSLMVHDNILQVEAAINYLVEGKNPYSENYFGTDLEKQSFISTTTHHSLVNPALFHLIKLPFHIIFSAPFSLTANFLFDFFDERIVYLLLFLISLLLLYELPDQQDNKYVLIACCAFNPLFLLFFATGRDDVFVLSWLILTIYLLHKNKILWSAFALALACTSKHSAWFIVPFYYIYAYGAISKSGQAVSIKNKLLLLFKKTWIFPVVSVIILLPFVVWDPISFFQDIYAYPAGFLPTSYPINGYGLSVLLYKYGLVQQITDYLPMWILQIPIVLGLYYFLIKKQLKENNLSNLLFNYAMVIFVYWLLSRFFHDNYVGFVAQLLIISYFISQPEIKKTAPPYA